MQYVDREVEQMKELFKAKERKVAEQHANEASAPPSLRARRNHASCSHLTFTSTRHLPPAVQIKTRDADLLAARAETEAVRALVDAKEQVHWRERRPLIACRRVLNELCAWQELKKARSEAAAAREEAAAARVRVAQTEDEMRALLRDMDKRKQAAMQLAKTFMMQT